MTHVHGSRFAEAVGLPPARALRESVPTDRTCARPMRCWCTPRCGSVATSRRWRPAGGAVGLFPQDAELRFREGVLLHELGRLDEARQAYLDVLSNAEERHFSSVDRGLTGFKAHQNLAVVATEMGDLAEAERQWREVVREVPRYRPGWRGLGETLIRGGRFAEAEALAEELLKNDGALRIEGLLIKSRTALARQQFAEARDALDRPRRSGPDDLETLRGRCQFLFEHGAPDEAERALKSLIEHDPHDASAHHNLGTLLLRPAPRRGGAGLPAVAALPAEPRGHLPQLGYALKDSGRLTEAVTAWEHVLRLVPGDPSARQELIRRGKRERLWVAEVDMRDTCRSMLTRDSPHRCARSLARDR